MVRMTVEPERIAVIVEREGLGDALLKLPMLRAIKRARPDSEVWWLASHQTAMEDALRPHTQHLIARVVSGLKLSEKPHRSMPRLRRLPRFEVVFDTRTRVADVIMGRLALRPREFYSCLPGYLFSTRRPPGLWDRPRGIGARAMSLASAAFGAAADGSGDLPVSAAVRAEVEAALPLGQTYVGFAPGSREPRKNWPLERFIETAGAIAADGLTPVFMIGPFEEAWLEQIRGKVPSALVPVSQPIERALAVLARMRAVVANDSGLGHMTGALGVPLVSLFGPTDAERWRPVGGPVKVVRAQEFGGETMDAIPVAPVLAALREMLPH